MTAWEHKDLEFPFFTRVAASIRMLGRQGVAWVAHPSAHHLLHERLLLRLQRNAGIVPRD